MDQSYQNTTPPEITSSTTTPPPEEEKKFSGKTRLLARVLLLMVLVSVLLKVYPYINNYLNLTKSRTQNVPTHTQMPTKHVEPPITNADSSYIEIYTNPEIRTILRDASGNFLEQSSLESISDPTGESKHVIANNTLYYAKPESSKYTVEITNTTDVKTSYTLQILLYDKNGNSTSATKSGTIGVVGKKEFIIEFNKQDSKSSVIQ